MKLYLAGLYTSNFWPGGTMHGRLTEVERSMRDGIQHYLESYHYINRQSLVDRIRRDGVRLFLDSGAFSAYTQGVTIDLPDYTNYIKRNADIVGQASVLDAIGDYRGTFENQRRMEALGTPALPCFHYGEPMEVLDWYVANYDYITIGGMVPISTPQLKLWLDRLFLDHLTHPDGTPKVKVHGFGLTSLPLMERYPWYSVDSSTWVQWAAHGMVLIPGIGRVSVSDRSSHRKTQGQHLDSVAPIERERIEEVIRSHGVDPDRMRTFNGCRWAWNCWAFPYHMRHKVYETDKFIPDRLELF